LPLLLSLAVSGCLGPVAGLYPAEEEQRPVTIHLTSHGWHVRLVLEREQVAPFLPPLEEMPQTRYLEFGWGDAGFYPHPDPGLREMLAAALLPTPAVMHIAGIDRPVAQRFPQSRIIRLQISGAGLEALGEYLAGTIRPDDEGRAVYLGEGLYGDSVFVDAHGPYIIPFTSNLWAARGLRAAGLAIPPVYAVTQGNLMYQAGRIGEALWCCE
jgi:uncharacterized protein (TIGR02117 family)